MLEIEVGVCGKLRELAPENCGTAELLTTFAWAFEIDRRKNCVFKNVTMFFDICHIVHVGLNCQLCFCIAFD